MRMFQVKIMLMYFCKITLVPLLIYCIRKNDISGSVVVGIVLILTFLADFLFRYIDLKQNPVLISKQVNLS